MQVSIGVCVCGNYYYFISATIALLRFKIYCRKFSVMHGMVGESLPRTDFCGIPVPRIKVFFG